LKSSIENWNPVSLGTEKKEMADPPPPPIQPLAPGNFDRAWNDPPLFSYNPGTVQPGTGSRLTRRIGFPASSTAPPLPTGTDPTAPPSLHDAGAKPPPSLLPPPPSLMVVAPSSTAPASPSTNTATSDPSVISLNADDLEETLTGLTENHFDSVKAKEVGKRLDGLVAAHRADTLGTRIPVLLAKLLASLKNEDLTGAESSFMTLSADHGGEPGNAQWMVALRHLVSKVSEEKRKEKKPENEAITAPLLLPTN